MTRARSVHRWRHNVPPPRTRLIGREDQVARVRELMQAGTSRLFTLTGAGGCGKTRLAYAVAAELADSFPDGARVIELAAVTDPRHVLPTLASSLGVQDRASRPLLDSLIAYLAHRRILLVLDNCEHLIEATARLTDQLLQACAAVHVLATSREPLRIAGEATYRVPSLAIPDLSSRQSLLDLSQVASVRLFVERAQAVQPDFTLTSLNAPTVAAICARLEGLPLAIELAAAWERALGVDEILARLADTFQLLVGGSRTAPTRQQTMWATLDWSHALLTASERAMFRRLAVFAGGWTLAAAEAVCAAGEVAQAEVLSLLTRLVDTSLVVETERDGRARYRLLEPIRAFAADHLGASGEANATGAAHAEYFLELAERLGAKPLGDPAMYAAMGSRVDEMEREYQNFRLVLQWLGNREPLQSALWLANVLAELWQFRGYLTEGLALMTWLLQRPGGEPRTRARVLGWAGNFAWLQGDLAAARVLHEQTLAIDLEAGEGLHAACALSALGRDALALGEYREAERLFDEALSGLQVLPERGAQAVIEESWVLFSLGTAAYEQRDWARAEEFHTRSLECAAPLGGENPKSAQAQYGLALVAHQQGDLERARSLHERALADQRAFDDSLRLPLTLVGLGQVLLDQHDVAGARASFAESLTLFNALGDQAGVARALDACAALAMVDNQAELACRLVGAAERIRAAGHTPLSPADSVDLARRLEPTRQLVGDGAVVAHTAVGRTLSTAQAVELARTALAVPEAHAPRVPTSEGAVLTPRELEVAALIGRGLSNRQISEQLVITRRTAAAHVEHILSKLGFTSRTQVGIWASDHGLLT